MDPADDHIQSLIRTAACARAPGEHQPRSAVLNAARQGRVAAEHGLFVPLPVLLDVWAFLDTPRYLLYERKSSEPPAESVQHYDKWLDRLSTTISARFGRARLAGAGLLAKAEAPVAPWDYLWTVIAAWPASRADAAEKALLWREAYRAIEEKAACAEAVHKGWSGSRCTDMAIWREWFPNVPPAGQVSESHMLWDLFRSSRTSAWVHEQADHCALKFYLSAEDPTPLPDQRQRIRRLRLRRREMASHPFPTAHEEQDRRGAIPLSLLAWEDCLESEDYGIFMTVNNMGPRITDVPPSQRPGRFQVHLSWVCGPTAVMRRPSGDHGKFTSHAAVLQGLVALLLDDWREFFSELPLDYHLHQDWPMGRRCGPVRGGPRWKSAGKDAKGTLPPRDVVGTVFRRVEHTQVCRDGCRWPGRDPAQNRPSAWWCGCALQTDLEDMGFTRGEKDSRTYWTGSRDMLSDCIAHLVVVDDLKGVSRLFEVQRLNGHAHLRPTSRRPFENDGVDRSFLALRRQAVDVLLSVLERRMC